MDRDDLLEVRALYDAQMRRGAQPDSDLARVERVGAVVRYTTPGRQGWNGVLWSELDEGNADAEIAAQIAHFGQRARSGQPADFEWKLYDYDRPADLAQRLRAAGFVPEPPETLLVARTADLARLPVEPPEGITLRVVRDEAGVDLMMEAHARAFGVERPRIREQILGLLRERPQTIEAVVAMAGETPVSAARMEMVPGSSFGLWGGGTAPSGAVAASTACWSPTAPAWRRSTASPTSRWTRRPTAARSWSAWASGCWGRRCRTSGRAEGGRGRPAVRPAH